MPDPAPVINAIFGVGFMQFVPMAIRMVEQSDSHAHSISDIASSYGKAISSLPIGKCLHFR